MVQPIAPHDLRHTCASPAVSAGANVLALARPLGHKDAKETLHTYADLFDDDLDEVAQAIHDAHARRNVGQMWALGPDGRSAEMKKAPHLTIQVRGWSGGGGI